MTPGVRKSALTAHVTSSVSWLGAVAGFLFIVAVLVVIVIKHLAGGGHASHH